MAGAKAGGEKGHNTHEKYGQYDGDACDGPLIFRLSYKHLPNFFRQSHDLRLGYDNYEILVCKHSSICPERVHTFVGHIKVSGFLVFDTMEQLLNFRALAGYFAPRFRTGGGQFLLRGKDPDFSPL